MKRICPNPMQWSEIFKNLTEYAQSHPCRPPTPPKPLILSGWTHTNDIEKLERWEETITWASENNCARLISEIPDSAFYFVDTPTTYQVGPFGGPMYRSWESEPSTRPDREQVDEAMDTLTRRWPEIAGTALAGITRPLKFTGEKARRLLVLADPTASPPWGEWARLSANESERRTFTSLRAAVNAAIAPHEVDHIDFVNEWKD